MADDSNELNTAGLDKFVKMLKGKMPSVKVGIFGDGRNASIGACHEFGTTKMAKRSFLREPLAQELDNYLERSNLFSAEVLKDVMEKGDPKPWLKIIGGIAEIVVQDAFQTAGFGKWAAWKTPGYENNSGQILVDSAQLMRSITSVVK